MSLRKTLLIILISLLTVTVMIYRANPGFFREKILGSFEYVRKGEECLDKGRYKDAISYFKKAFEASPKNKDIQGALLWAYTKYGMNFADSGNYDKAIENLTKAYEVKTGSASSQNLAIIYSKKALEEARGDDWSGAIGSLREAVSLASDFPNAGRNLSISLFNDAVEEYKHDRERIALTWLKVSALLYEESRIFDFLGEIYYKKRDMERALFYWNKAEELNPEDKALAEKLEKLNKEMELAKAESKIESPHFEVRYEKNLDVDSRLVNQTLESAYFDVGRDLGYFPPSKTIVFFYSEDDFRNIFKLPEIVRAFYDGNIRMPYPKDVPDKEDLRRYVYHEYAHAVVSAKTNNNCPTWFSEGISMWQEFKGKELAVKDLLSKTEEFEFNLRYLNDGFGPGSGDRDMRIYYILSYTVVRYIVDTWGLEGLRDILKRLAGGQHVVNAIDDEFLLSEKEFTKRWSGYVQKK